MHIPRSRLLKLAVLSEVGAFLVAIILAFLLNIDILPATKAFQRDILIGTVYALPPLALFIFSLSDKASSIPVVKSLRNTMLSEIRAIFRSSSLLDILIISACAGIAEELLFRGVLQARFGIIIASVLFGLVHFVTPAYVAAATIMGFYMGFLLNVSESLLVPIQTHFIYDLGALLYLRYSTADISDEGSC